MKIAASLLTASLIVVGSVRAQDPEGGNSPNEITPLTIEGAETHPYKTVGNTELLLHIAKPKGWTADKRLPCLVAFFGGGWSSGSPERSFGTAKWAARLGMVGVAPDYRTKNRFKGTPEDCVADGRAAVRWVQDHAAELGVDPAKIIVMGSSAGGHVGAWTAIPGAEAEGLPSQPPAALVLLWPVTDTSATGYGGPKRFSGDAARAEAMSVTAMMPAKMPPTLVIHGTADETVSIENSKKFVEAMRTNGNVCEFIPLEGAPHAATSSKLGEVAKSNKAKVDQDVAAFLEQQGFIPGRQGGEE